MPDVSPARTREGTVVMSRGLAVLVSIIVFMHSGLVPVAAVYADALILTLA